MNFNSLSFILLFLPIVVLVHALIRKTSLKNIFLIMASLLFYLWGSFDFFAIFALISGLAYCIGLLIEKVNCKKTLVFTFCVIIILILGYYKYTDFGIRIINKVLSREIDFLYLSLPLGISFFTFQSISYIVDIYRKTISAEKNIIRFYTYISFFPSVTSGPIIRYSQMSKELIERKSSSIDISEGFQRFIIGLAKKVILANNIAIIADLGFKSSNLANLPWQIAWMSAIAYTFQIYYDFSGYSDMALGIGRMLGFGRIKENFEHPYCATSIGDFWRRWHISLGTWFRDYVYIPLGGNRVTKFRWLINIAIVWSLTGLWHGASAVFVLWGTYFGALLIAEKWIFGRILNKTPKIIRHFYTLFFVLIGWIIFNSTSLDALFMFIKALVRTRVPFDFQAFMLLDIFYLWPVVVACFIFSFPVSGKITGFLEKNKVLWIKDIITIGLLVVSFVLLINSTYSPFIYFNF